MTLDFDVIVAPNPSPMTGRGTNTYVLGRGDEVVVIDPGPADIGHVENIQAAVKARGHAKAVLLTHHHTDHSESAAEVGRRLAAPVAAIPHELAPPLDRILGDRDQVEAGDITLEVLGTPGHCRDHACFWWHQTGAVFVGDLVAGEGFIVIDPPDGDMTDYLNSLAKLRDSRFGTHATGAGEPGVLLPGHGPAIDDPRTYLDGYISHRLAREAKVLAALATDASSSLDAILPIAYDDTPEAMYPVAARSLQAHLDKLVRDGAAEQSAEGYCRLA